MTEESYGLADDSDHQATLSADPVCGVTVDEEAAAGKLGFWGQMYYFCSEQCRRTFKDDPERYAGQQR